MANIFFTQYLRPDGRRQEVWIDRPDSIAAKAETIINAGCRFEAEVLMSGWISLTITDDEDDQARKLVTNGEMVPNAVDELIMGFDVQDYILRKVLPR